MKQFITWLTFGMLAQSITPIVLVALLVFPELPRFTEFGAALLVLGALTAFYIHAGAHLSRKNTLWITLISSVPHAILATWIGLWSWSSPTIGLVAFGIGLSLIVILGFNGVALLSAVLFERRKTAVMKPRSRWLVAGLAVSIALNVALLLYGVYVSIDTGVTITYMAASLESTGENLETMQILLQSYASNATQAELEQHAVTLNLPVKIESETEMWVGQVLFRFDGDRLSGISP